VDPFFFFFFASTRGIQQGDQLSSLLFALVVEALSQLNSKAVDGGYLTGFTANMADNDLLKISHLLFVDDTLCLCNAKPNHICYFFFLMHVVIFLKQCLFENKFEQIRDCTSRRGNTP
jgi:hypothetical protein